MEVDEAGTSLLDRLERLREAIRAGEARSIADELAELAEEHPTNIAVLSTLTPAYVQMGRPELALEANRRALELGRDHARVRLSLSLLTAQQGTEDQALEHVERALELNPVFAEAWAHLGRLQIARGDDEAAVRALTEALHHGDTRTETHLSLARAHGRLGAWSAAEETLVRAPLVRAPGGGTLELWTLLAAVRAELGDEDGAWEAYEEAVRRAGDPRELEAVRNKLRAMRNDG